MTPLYLDHSATTPLDSRVLDAMMPHLTENYGNSSSGHLFGRQAEHAIETARETVAGILNCQPREIIFTSGGSESDNLAVRGAAWSARAAGKGAHLITSSIEHGAVGKTVEQLAKIQGFTSTVLPVNRFGSVSVADFEAAIRPDTTLASIMYANNEVGTIQPIEALTAITRQRGILFHTDAVQAAGQLCLDVQQLGVDLLSLSAHKFYGPKGSGALYVRESTDILTTQTGGGHEFGLRAGTVATAQVVGLAKALELAYNALEARTEHYRELRDRLIDGVLTHVPNAHLTGHPEERLPSHASFVFEGIDSNGLLSQLEAAGIAGSAASACKTGSAAPSSVVLALGYKPAIASCSLRLTVGTQTSLRDIDFAVGTIATVIQSLALTEAVTA